MIRNLNDKVRYIGCDDLDLDLFESQYIVPENLKIAVIVLFKTVFHRSLL